MNQDNNPSQTPQNTDPKQTLVWYNNKDRYSIDFDSVLFMFDKWMNDIASNSNYTDEYKTLTITSLHHIKTSFDNQFKTIKGDHILHNLGVQEIPSLKEIAPDKDCFPEIDVEQAIQNNQFDYKIQGEINNQESPLKMYVTTNTLSLIVHFLITKNREKGNTQSEAFFRQLETYLVDLFVEIYAYDKSKELQSSITDKQN